MRLALALTLIFGSSIAFGQSMTFPQAQQYALTLYGPNAMTAEVRRGNSPAIERWIGPSTGYGGCDMVLMGKTVGSNWLTTVNGVQPLPPMPTVPAGVDTRIVINGVLAERDSALEAKTRAELYAQYPNSGLIVERAVSQAIRDDLERRLMELVLELRALNPQAADQKMQEKRIWIK